MQFPAIFLKIIIKILIFFMSSIKSYNHMHMIDFVYQIEISAFHLNTALAHHVLSILCMDCSTYLICQCTNLELYCLMNFMRM